MRDEVLTTRVSCTGSEWKDDGRHGGCLFLLWWHTYSMTALGSMMVANVILYDLSHALVKFEDPKE